MRTSETQEAWTGSCVLNPSPNPQKIQIIIYIYLTFTSKLPKNRVKSGDHLYEFILERSLSESTCGHHAAAGSDVAGRLEETGSGDLIGCSWKPDCWSPVSASCSWLVDSSVWMSLHLILCGGLINLPNSLIIAIFMTIVHFLNIYPE